jgi:hypothetical protein
MISHGTTRHLYSGDARSESPLGQGLFWQWFLFSSVSAREFLTEPGKIRPISSQICSTFINLNHLRHQQPLQLLQHRYIILDPAKYRHNGTVRFVKSHVNHLTGCYRSTYRRQCRSTLKIANTWTSAKCRLSISINTNCKETGFEIREPVQFVSTLEQNKS